jgi:mannose-6-phosphate isomerase-like protein (cupin superfamily)
MTKPIYTGPKSLSKALSKLRLERREDAKFHREGLRADSEYRDLDEVTVTAGSALSQPAGVPHNVIARSEDLELLELNMPADYGTFER